MSIQPTNKQNPSDEKIAEEENFTKNNATKNAAALLSSAVTASKSASKRIQTKISPHTPQSLDKNRLEKQKSKAQEIYRDFSGDSLEDLQAVLEKNEIHAHIEKPRNSANELVRAFYHPPVIATVGEERLVLNEFYHDFVLPKVLEEENSQGNTEEPQKAKKKSLFRRKKNK